MLGSKKLPLSGLVQKVRTSLPQKWSKPKKMKVRKSSERLFPQLIEIWGRPLMSKLSITKPPEVRKRKARRCLDLSGDIPLRWAPARQGALS